MKHTEPLNLSIVADVALDGALKRELVNFLLLLPTRSAQTRRVSDCFRLSRLTTSTMNCSTQVLGAWSGIHAHSKLSLLLWLGRLLRLMRSHRSCSPPHWNHWTKAMPRSDFQRNAVNASSGWVGWLGMAGVFGSRMPWGAVSTVSAVHYLPSCSTV